MSLSLRYMRQRRSVSLSNFPTIVSRKGGFGYVAYGDPHASVFRPPHLTQPHTCLAPAILLLDMVLRENLLKFQFLWARHACIP